MDTNIKKKGRMAMAWLIIITMVIATMSTPFAFAKPADPPLSQPTPVTPGITFDLSTFDKPDGITDGDYTTYRIPADADFIIFKQGSENSNQTSYLWTPIEIDTTLQEDIIAQVRYWADNGGDGSLKGLLLSNLEYIYGTGTVGIYDYVITEENGEFVIVVEKGTLSHLSYGMYEEANDTVELAFTKELTGMDLESDMFDFTLSEATIEEDDTWVEGDVLQTISNTDSMNDNVVFNDLVFDEEGTFYFIIKELDVDPIDGVTYDNHVVKLTVTVEEIGEGVFDAVAVFDGAMVFTNTYEEEEYGSIPVTKTVEIPDGATFNVPYTFYVALFDEEGMMYDEYDPLELTVTSGTELTATGTFTGLDLEQVYNVYEVYMVEDKFVKIETNPIDDMVISPEGIPWKTIEYANNEDISVFGDDNIAATVTVNNVFTSQENPFDPSVKVIKTVTVNNKPTASNLTFYAGLFEDKELTKLVAFKPLPLNGGVSAEASFAFYQDGVTPLKAGMTYYVAETDSTGKPLAGTAKELGFEITINGVTNNNSTVVLIEEEAVVNIVNNFKKEEFPLTGDNSNMNLWLFLAMLGVAGAIAPFAFRKKEVAND